MFLVKSKGKRIELKVEADLRDWMGDYKDVSKIIEAIQDEIKKEFIRQLSTDLFRMVKEDVKEKLAKEVLASFNAKEEMGKYFMGAVKDWMDSNKEECSRYRPY